MARRKAGDKKVIVGNVTGVSGKVTIAGGDIYEGYTVEQVSLLLKEFTTHYRRKPFDGRCPYKGLEVFEEEDADLFFGRERLVEDLVSRVEESRTVFITGPSGSGKSSLVRAGLIHALKDGALKGSNDWKYETMKPGREPIKELALAFSRLKSPELANYFQAHANEVDILNQCAESVLTGQKNQRFVLFVDQFEEVFTQINQEEERQAFINMLAHAGTVDNGRVIVLFAMRSDFVSNCATYPALNELLSQEFRQIGAMQPEELVSAIALPAIHVGLPIEDDLIARIINDMKGEPGALPLMQFALKDLFDSQQAKGGVVALTLEDYLKHGGIQKSLERHADASLAALDEKSQNLARSIFSGLIEIGRGRQDTKRTALFDELVPANTNAEEVSVVVQKLADARLIITDEQAGKDTVTISHEKLIDAWPWLKKLVDESRDVIALQNEIANDVKEWEDHGRDASYLYSGARLANVREQLQARKLVLNDIAQAYVQAGLIRERRSQVTLIAGISVIIVLLFLAVIVFRNLSITNANIASTAQAAGINAIAQRGTAQAASTVAVAQQATARANAEDARLQAAISRAGQLAAQSIPLKDKDFQLSLLLGIEAYQSFTTIQSRGVLLDNTQAYPQLRTFLNGYTHQVYSVAFSPDGKIFASGSCAKSFYLEGSPTDVICVQGEIILWDVATHQPISQPLMGHTNWVRSVAFSPDGRTLASGSCRNTTDIPSAPCDEGELLLWNVSTRQIIGQPLRGHTSSVSSVAFSPDGRTLASGSDDHTIILWDVSTRQMIGQPLSGHDTAVNSVAFSFDGKTLASGGDDTTIILWNVSTRQIIGQPLRGHTSSVSSVAFSPDGRTLASGSCGKSDEIGLCVEGEIILWDVFTRHIIGQPLMGHDTAVDSIAFSLDGKTLASGGGNSEGSSIILWDVSTGKPIGEPLSEPTSSYLTSVAFSPDSKTLASGSCGKLGVVNRTIICAQGEVIWWDISTGKPIGQSLQGHTSSVYSIAFSPDGKTMASGSCAKIVDSYCVHGEILLWDLSTGKPIGQPLSGHSGTVYGLAFSPDGKTLASASDGDSTILLWDVSTHQRVGQPLQGHSSRIESVVFSPDGKILASGGWDSSVILWDTATQQPIGQLLPEQISDYNSSANGPVSGYTYILSLAFSPDGKTLASGRWDGMIILWDVATRPMIGQPLTGHTDFVESLAFSPDGKTLVSGSGRDDTLIFWDPVTGQMIGQPLPGHGANALAFTADGKTLVSGNGASISLWDMATHSSFDQLLVGQTDIFQSAALSPNGRTLASGGCGERDSSGACIRGEIILWDLDPVSWIEKSCQRVGRNLTRAEWGQFGFSEPYRATCPQYPLEAVPSATPSPTP